MRTRALPALLLAITAACPSPARAADAEYALPSGEVLPGVRLSDLTSLGAQIGRVRAAARTALDVELADVPVHVLTIDELRALHGELGGRLPPRWSLGGFELDGHVFVRRGLGGIPDEVLVHECLHALSRRFTNEASRAGARKLVEGVTQHLTLRALAARPQAGLARERNRTYVAYTELADALETLVGAARLRAAYFGEGWDRLAREVDAQRRGRGVLARAARLLEGGDEVGALALLTGAR